MAYSNALKIHKAIAAECKYTFVRPVAYVYENNLHDKKDIEVRIIKAVTWSEFTNIPQEMITQYPIN